MSLNGIDTSNNNTGVPDATIPADFIIFKATEGIGYVDRDCAASYAEAKGANKLLGVYDFARPDGNDPVAEADFFVDNVKGYIGQAVLILDWEHSPTNDVAWAKQWLDHVFARTGIRPWIYMNQSTANGNDWSSVWNDYALWVAAYGTNVRHDGYAPSENISVNGNWNIAAWQYTSNGYLPGYAAPLDLNVFFGDRAAWNKYATVPAAPAPTPEPQPTHPDGTPIPAPADPIPNEPASTPVPAPTPVPVPEPTIPPVVPAPEPVTVKKTPVHIKVTLAATVIAIAYNLILAALRAFNIL